MVGTSGKEENRSSRSSLRATEESLGFARPTPLIATLTLHFATLTPRRFLTKKRKNASLICH